MSEARPIWHEPQSIKYADHELVLTSGRLAIHRVLDLSLPAISRDPHLRISRVRMHSVLEIGTIVRREAVAITISVDVVDCWARIGHLYRYMRNKVQNKRKEVQKNPESRYCTSTRRSGASIIVNTAYLLA